MTPCRGTAGSHAIPWRRWSRQQAGDQGLDPAGDAVGGEGVADGAAVGGEIGGRIKRDAGGNALGLGSGGGEIGVERIAGGEFGNRQFEWQEVEIACAALALGLHGSDASPNLFAIEDGGKIVSFVPMPGRRKRSGAGA